MVDGVGYLGDAVLPVAALLTSMGVDVGGGDLTELIVDGTVENVGDEDQVWLERGDLFDVGLFIVENDRDVVELRLTTFW